MASQQRGPAVDASAEPDAMIDHIGWRLWRATAAWKARYVAAMRAAGHEWYTEARASVIANLPPQGARQADLTRSLGVSKQAAQQMIDELAAAGVLRREPDPADKRGKVVRYTDAGAKAHRDAVAIKRQIEADYRARLGDDTMDTLAAALGAVADLDDAPS